MLHFEDGEKAWDMELPRRVTLGDGLRQAIETVLGEGTYDPRVIRRKAVERKPWAPKPGVPAQDEVA
jgi:hypothetical protein